MRRLWKTYRRLVLLCALPAALWLGYIVVLLVIQEMRGWRP